MFKFPLELIYSTYRKLVANPKYRWWVIAGTLAYLISPLDISPDVIPFIGEIDDAIVVTMLATELVGIFRNRTLAMKQKSTTDVMADGEIIEAKVAEVV